MAASIGDDMGFYKPCELSCSGTHKWREKVVNGDVQFVCDCGQLSQYHPVPSYEILLEENRKLKNWIDELNARIKQIEEVNS